MGKEENIAYHEAGHAVAALVLFSNNVRASVEADYETETWGRVNYSRPKVAPVSSAVIACAGPCAEWRVMSDGEDGKDCMGGSDAEQFLEMIDEIEPDPAEQKHAVIGVIRLAEELLDEHWASVTKVAEALLKSTSLSAAELLELHTEH
jgi:hypothetical protein